MIFERIDHLPKEIEGLCTKMWNRMNGNSPIYHKEAARFLNIAVTHSRLRLKFGLSLVGIILATTDDYRKALDQIAENSAVEIRRMLVLCDNSKRWIKLRAFECRRI